VSQVIGEALLTGWLIAAAAVAHQQPAVDPLPSVALPPELARVLTDYEKAWRAKDASALAQLFADDRVVVPNSCAPVKGRAKVQECYTGAGGALFLRATAYAAAEGQGYIIGSFRLTEADGDVGKFVLTLVKGPDARWLVVADMDRPYQKR
jgi:ketosteroid isomerase-like protein